MSALRFKISMSLDGFVAGPNQSVDNPLGIGGGRLHEWAFQLTVFRALLGFEGGTVNESTPVVEESLANIGVTVMRRNGLAATPAHGIPRSRGTVGGESIRRSTNQCSCSRTTHASHSNLKAVRPSRSSPTASRWRSNWHGEPLAVKMYLSPAERVPHNSISLPASWTRWRSMSCRRSSAAVRGCSMVSATTCTISISCGRSPRQR